MIVAPCYLKGRAFWGFASLLLAIFAAAAVPAFGKGSADDLEAFILKARSEYKVPGIAVAIIQKDQIILLKGYGTSPVG